MCNADHDSPLCQNGGTCVDDVTVDRYKYRCDCGDSGFSGRTCETNTHDCTDNACKNGVGKDADGKTIEPVTLDPDGTCVDGTNKYTCTCHPGFGGEHCMDHVNECTKGDNPCLNDGVCTPKASAPLGYTCACDATHHGQRCGAEGPDPCSPNPCGKKHDGTDNVCRESGDSYTCMCPPGKAFRMQEGGGKTCGVCPDGKMPNKARNANACKDCPPGKAGTGGSCEVCPDGQGPATKPPEGGTGPKAKTVCVACPAGKATTSPGSGQCQKCADGHTPILPGKTTVLFVRFYITMIILPRQARDKHRQNSKKTTVATDSQRQPGGNRLHGLRC
eukprot:COSAG06_NODE_368_length_16746_cov_12.229771_13_plen_332_part_00